MTIPVLLSETAPALAVFGRSTFPRIRLLASVNIWLYQPSVQLRMSAFQEQPISGFHAASMRLPTSRLFHRHVCLPPTTLSDHCSCLGIPVSSHPELPRPPAFRFSRRRNRLLRYYGAPGEWDAYRCMGPVFQPHACLSWFASSRALCWHHAVVCHVHDPMVVLRTSALPLSMSCCPQALISRLGSLPTILSSWRMVFDLSVVDCILHTSIGLGVLLWPLIRVSSVVLWLLRFAWVTLPDPRMFSVGCQDGLWLAGWLTG
jgi:hypothetical protein